MTLICCIAKNGGMLFQGKRVSRDMAVSEKILSLMEGKKLYLSPSSATLFPESEKIVAVENPMAFAGEDFCFVENCDFSPEDADTIYLFHWNRDYPADAFFPFDVKAEGYRKIKKEDFAGNSHKKITLEIYQR